ncbi:hypothetical protein CK203_013071 [Vitis vinifera]|uniref:Uncharacterized protein n=1 Tax=Vitis vinifera TaxID=29760 RepID=A0A438JLW2_VITVI|nr:hypothetical protein CK203_013071 [Vitis vinifera]
MCGGDDHLAWKHPASSEACRGLRTVRGTPSLHLGASEGLQSLFDHSWDSIFPLLVSSESAPRSVRVWCGFAILGQSRGDISSLFREIRHGSAGCHSWLVHRCHGFYSVEGILVRLSERSDMDQRVVTLISSRPPWLLFRRPWPLRVSDSSSTWDDLDSIPVASLPAKFRMPDIERYTSVGCPCIHLRLYSTVMKVHGLDESQMITMFLLSLSGVAQH